MKVILIGDIHFGKLCITSELSVPGEPIQDNTRGAIPLKESFINAVKDIGADYLFVVGDLTSTGSPIEYSRCISDIYNMASEINISRDNVIINVGNHDIDRRIIKLGEPDFKVEASYPTTELTELYQQIAASHGEAFFNMNIFTSKGPVPFSGVIERDGIILFVLNSAWRCSTDQSTKHGKLESRQVEWFEARSHEYIDDQRWKIVLLHHHPFNYPYPTLGHDISLLEEGAELIDIAGKYGINLICHGHRHHPKAHNEQHDDWLNSITFICSGSFSVNSSYRNYGSIPNVYHILDLDIINENKLVVMHSYEYSIGTGWEPIRSNCPETPLDKVMVFHKPYDKADRISEMQKLIDDEFAKADGQPFIQLPAWENLPIKLKTLRFKMLDEMIRAVAKNDYDVIGKYPESVALIRRA